MTYTCAVHLSCDFLSYNYIQFIIQAQSDISVTTTRFTSFQLQEQGAWVCFDPATAIEAKDKDAYSVELMKQLKPGSVGQANQSGRKLTKNDSAASSTGIAAALGQELDKGADQTKSSTENRNAPGQRSMDAFVSVTKVEPGKNSSVTAEACDSSGSQPAVDASIITVQPASDCEAAGNTAPTASVAEAAKVEEKNIDKATGARGARRVRVFPGPSLPLDSHPDRVREFLEKWQMRFGVRAGVRCLRKTTRNLRHVAVDPEETNAHEEKVDPPTVIAPTLADPPSLVAVTPDEACMAVDPEETTVHEEKVDPPTPTVVAPTLADPPSLVAVTPDEACMAVVPEVDPPTVIAPTLADPPSLVAVTPDEACMEIDGEVRHAAPPTDPEPPSLVPGTLDLPAPAPMVLCAGAEVSVSGGAAPTLDVPASCDAPIGLGPDSTWVADTFPETEAGVAAPQASEPDSSVAPGASNHSVAPLPADQSIPPTGHTVPDSEKAVTAAADRNRGIVKSLEESMQFWEDCLFKLNADEIERLVDAFAEDSMSTAFSGWCSSNDSAQGRLNIRIISLEGWCHTYAEHIDKLYSCLRVLGPRSLTFDVLALWEALKPLLLR